MVKALTDKDADNPGALINRELPRRTGAVHQKMHMAPLIIVGTGLAGYTFIKNFANWMPSGPCCCSLPMTEQLFQTHAVDRLWQAKTADELAMNDAAAMAALAESRSRVNVRVGHRHERQNLDSA